MEWDFVVAGRSVIERERIEIVAPAGIKAEK
jgi:hypothetical protein